MVRKETVRSQQEREKREGSKTAFGHFDLEGFQSLFGDFNLVRRRQQSFTISKAYLCVPATTTSSLYLPTTVQSTRPPVLLVGIPNVGKSALANSLHHIGRISVAEKGKLKHATMSPLPGETKDINSLKRGNAIGSVPLAIVTGLGALTHTLGTLVLVIGASGFATTAAATAIGIVVGSFR